MIVDADRENDLGTVDVEPFELRFAGTSVRPIRQRCAVAILRLEQPDGFVRQVEFDIERLEEIFPEQNADIVAGIVLASDKETQLLLHGLANHEFVDQGDLDLGFATNPE